MCVLTSVVAVTCLTPPGAGHIDHDTKIQMAVVEAGDEAIRRLAHDRKYPDHVSGRDQARTRRFQPQRRDQQIAQRQQRLGPSRLTRHHAFSGTPRVEIAILDFNAEGVGELRAG